MTNKLVALFSLKMAERSEAKSAKRSFASKKLDFLIFDAKLRFALLASFRSVIFKRKWSDQLIGHFARRG